MDRQLLKASDMNSQTIVNMPVGFHGKFCMEVNDERHTWFIQSLIKATSKLPVVNIELKELDKYLDENTWFHGENKPTIRAFIQHYQRVEQSDLSFPIIMTPKVGVIDGLHRLVKAYSQGLSSIKAVILAELPEPDYIGDY